ncbi:cysteine and histidine-rich domain-containing protein morgana [Tribolium castaneum]|uniref:Cysteine and histidine-rich domain-containing protein-like Protein n=1 Tax=Tribolium castaneum TaxID=7070 RepID=D6W993_TRICA|nr:PREDICTED: cysteine and histidine-rich domain-containing protein [Tribolium castaneum]EEZ98197.1 Cysteine and histidine-rich domain-containing protein-like Protein [Tribolium castaneum]|eukprot:XP_967567.1 PREDICTED: cysteine and histidine-rich domain-containing protein [Tribolium castaneum]
MENGDVMLQCYNKGCGQKFDPSQNKEDSCCHHPGAPVFHDAYKGWSCCNKKCTDFTEFLNIKGCTKSKHSNVKPPEPEKPAKREADVNEVIEVKPIVPTAKERPPFDTPMTVMQPEIAPSAQQQVLNISNANTAQNSNEIAIGTTCKNGGCGQTYQGPETNATPCTHHPGVPIFHEGMKFWSCCQKRTTDFNAFLNQVGCKSGQHVWIKENADNTTVQCRWDYHQTATHVVVSIYAKQYCVKKSEIKLNPIRLYASLVFPQQNNAVFNLDLELRGIVDVGASQVSMYGTKVEIKLKKAEPGSWAKLDIPRVSEEKPKPVTVADITPQVDAVDLDDL